MEDKQIKRPSMKVLSDELLARIVEEAKDVLEETGVVVYNEEGLKILSDSGARTDPSELKAYIPRNLVETALKSVQAKFPICRQTRFTILKTPALNHLFTFIVLLP